MRDTNLFLIKNASVLLWMHEYIFLLVLEYFFCVDVAFSKVTNLNFSSITAGGTAGLHVQFQMTVQDTQQTADYTFHYTNMH